METKTFDASIVSLVAPMITNPITIDKFAAINDQVLPMFMVLMYLLPVYRYTSRLVTEKQRKTRDLTRLIGVGEAPYWLSWFVFFVCGVTIVSICCALILTFGVFKYTSFLPMLIFFWLYGVSLFGYILLISSFFRQSVTLASVVSTLFFFISSFVDLLVDNKYMPEYFTTLASMLPTVAIRRAVATITKLENQRRGFTFHTLNEVVYNYRMVTSFVMFAFAFFILGALGLYFSSVLETGGGHKKNWCFCLGCESRS